MRILFLTENFPPEVNAAATRVFERAVYWVKDGHQVDVITGAPNFPQGRLFSGYRNAWYQVETMSGIRVIRVKTFISSNEGVIRRTLDFVSFMLTGFVAGLVQSRPDVVVSTSPQFFTAVAGWMVAIARRRPFVFELGDLWPASIVAVGAIRPGPVVDLLERIELFLYRRSAAVVALTESFKVDLVRREISTEKITVVQNGVDLPRYSPRQRDAEFASAWGVGDSFVVGYIGTLGMAHGLANVLDAADRLRGDPSIRFLLVGPGAEREWLIGEARRRGLDNVIVAPPQPKEAMPRVWSLCDVALIHLKDSAAFAEVIPSKMFEAMAMGLPLLIAAPAGEASRIVEREDSGVWVPPGRPDALADAVVCLKTDGALRHRLAAAALAAAPHHSRKAQAERMLAVLTGVCHRAQRAAPPAPAV